MAAASLREILDALRDHPPSAGRRYKFTDADRDGIIQRVDALDLEGADAILDALERELEPFA